MTAPRSSSAGPRPERTSNPGVTWGRRKLAGWWPWGGAAAWPTSGGPTSGPAKAWAPAPLATGRKRISPAAAGTRTSRKSAATPARQLPPGTLKGLIRDKTSTKGAVEKGGGPTSASLSPGVHDDSSTRALPAPSGPVAASPADREKPDVPARHQSPSLQRTALGEIQAAVQT